MKRLWELSLS